MRGILIYIDRFRWYEVSPILLISPSERRKGELVKKAKKYTLQKSTENPHTYRDNLDNQYKMQRNGRRA